jgi:recombinational DNA repair protein (RecF pathway)
MTLFARHLRDTEEIDSFYFELLLRAAGKWQRQNPKRIVIESYLKLLKHEGRLHDEHQCYICESPIAHEVSLMQTFIPVHPDCAYGPRLDRQKIDEFFKSGESLYLEDHEVETLHAIVMRGF